MAKYKVIKLQHLLVNTENYRFEAIGSQKEAIDKMVEDQKEKLFNLAKDISEYGLNPNDRIQVIQSTDNQKKYIVLEGNRRTVALKLLDNPDLIDDVQLSNLKKKFRKLNSDDSRKIIEEVECTVYDSSAEADKWIKLKHAGQNDGVGTVNWNAQQIQRFEEQVEGKSSIALQVINFIRNSARTPKDVLDNLGKLKITNLSRLLADPDVRVFLGLNVTDGQLHSDVDREEVSKGLIQIAKDLLDPEFKVKNIYSKKDRKRYISQFPSQSTPDKNKKAPSKWGNTQASDKTIPKGKNNKTKPKTLPQNRNRLIPRKCSMSISNPKVNSIFHELKKLDIDKFTNAAAVSFRVFIELSIDCYIEEHGIANTPSATRSNMNFQKKINEVASHLQNTKQVDAAITKGIKFSIKQQNDLLGIDTWHAYVHNNRFSPNPKYLTTTWDGIQDFITILWNNIK
jgi:hypothetical protein